MLHFSEHDAKRFLNPLELIHAIELAFQHDYQAGAPIPTRLQLEVGSQGSFLLMPCQDAAKPALGFKAVLVSRHPASGNERVQATYFLLDPASGKVRAVIDANYLTDLRTAATSALATKLMARKSAAILGIFGAGRQARAHLKLFAQILQFKTILVCASSPQRSETFAAEMSAEVAVPVRPADAKTCAEQAHVICTCTSATLPLFDGGWLAPGVHLNLVGAFRPMDREVDSETIRRARAVVDTYEGALSEAGDIIIPLREGVIARSHIVADLHEMISGKRAGRTSEEEITVFKSVGFALEDLVAASLLYDAAAKSEAADDLRPA